MPVTGVPSAVVRSRRNVNCAPLGAVAPSAASTVFVTTSMPVPAVSETTFVTAGSWSPTFTDAWFSMEPPSVTTPALA